MQCGSRYQRCNDITHTVSVPANATIAMGIIRASGFSGATITGAWTMQGPVGIPIGPTGPTGLTGGAGPTGTAATIAVGTTTTGAPGSTASVSNSGSSSAASFNFTVPQGPTGPVGPSGGPIGPTGPQGATGAPVPTERPRPLPSEPQRTGAPGSTASVTNSGSTSAATFNFTVPAGPTGATGQVGTAYQGTSNGATVSRTQPRRGSARFRDRARRPPALAIRLWSPAERCQLDRGPLRRDRCPRRFHRLRDHSQRRGHNHHLHHCCGSSGCQDLTHTITVLAGDTLGIQMTPSASHTQTITGSWAILVPFTGAVGPAGPQALRVPLAPLARRVRLARPA